MEPSVILILKVNTTYTELILQLCKSLLVEKVKSRKLWKDFTAPAPQPL